MRGHGAGPECTPIAIIGMGCMFPKARNLVEYWRLLRSGTDGITDTPPTHWDIADYFDPDPKSPDMTYCHRGGFIPPVAFDPTEFGIPPTTLEATDTSQLLGLVVAKAALEDAGYGEGREFNREKTSVILGITGLQELALPLGARLGHPIWRKALAEAGVDPELSEDVIRRISDGYVSWQENSFPGLLGNVVAGRIANRLNLRGTNCVVDAACASSLSAVHLAMLELTAGRSDMALAGGVDTLNDIFMYMCFSKTPALSPTGDARPFADDADGTVLGEGIGMVVLKRLSDAQRDGDRIYAVIRAIGTSSDGRSQSIYAPHAGGQARALRNAHALARVRPDEITLIEAHGTGTKVGDAVEFDALRTVFREAASDGAWCAIGSVKSQIGHTKAAAGAAGLIKAALSLYHRAQTPTIKVNSPNPKMGIEESPFFISSRLRPWLAPARGTRIAGVSSFGFGGSNFHAILEEPAATIREPAWDGSVQIVALSAESIDGLQAKLIEWQQAVGSESSTPEDLAWRAGLSRRTFDPAHAHRLLMVFEAGENLNLVLEQAARNLLSRSDQTTWTAGGTFYGRGGAEGALALLFPGQGSQYIEMGRDLACTFPEMQEVLGQADSTGEPTEGRVSAAVYPQPSFMEEQRERHSQQLTRTDVAQPALGAIELGMMRILRRFGVRGEFAAGHSFGELVALCASGMISEASLHQLARLRGRLMASADADAGTMLVVKAPLGELERLIAEHGLDVVLANRNAPSQGVLSGGRAAIARAAEICKTRGFVAKSLNVAGAFHSRLMESAAGPFRMAMDSIEFRAPNMAVIANATASAYPSDSQAAKSVLGRQILEPVDFVGVIESLYKAGARSFVEVGPKAVLSGLTGSILDGRPHGCVAMDASAGRKSGVGDLARCLCKLAASGHRVDFEKWERPAVEPRKPRMVVPMVGANYRAPRVEREAVTATVDRPQRKELTATADHPPELVQAPPILRVPNPPTDAKQATPSNHNAMQMPMTPSSVPNPSNSSKPGSTPPAALVEALRMVQEGLQAMQALQQNTAAAHQRFLESQEQAHRSIQQLIENQHRLLAGSIGGSAAPTVAAPSSGTPVAPVVRAPEIIQAVSRPVVMERPAIQETVIPSARPISSPPPAVVETRTEKPTQAAAPVVNRADVVLDVVCEKTGYPREMIELGMDIEADLGIDSIKRVEIVAAIEERIAGFDGIKPEYMGSIRTLAEIVAFIESAGPPTKAEPTRNRDVAKQPSNTEVAVDGGKGISIPAFSSTLLDVVSQLTGYPREMLDLNMDMEADLGIDSIKRVEILAGVEARVPQMPTVQPDYMGSLRTLQQIVDYCAIRGEGGKTVTAVDPAPVAAPPMSLRKVERRILAVHELPPAGDGGRILATGRVVWVTDDGSGVGRALVGELQTRGLCPELIDATKPPQRTDGVAGLIVVARRPNPGETLWALDGEESIKSAFRLIQRVAKSLSEAGAEGGAILATVSRMDGRFGLSRGDFEPTQGGLAGLVKTAAHEWSGVRCKAIDVASAWQDVGAIASAIARELVADGPLEIGLDPDRRRGLRLEVLSVRPSPIGVGKQDVIVITGGARGVTAETAVALAKAAGAKLVLLGRSPSPNEEPEWLAGLETEAEIKQAILSKEFAGRERPKASDLQAAYARHLANREIRNNLARMADAGAQVLYRSVDVLDSESVRAVMEEVGRVLGPITGIIHAAGVLEDRLIADKTAEQFSRVFDTKVVGLRNLLGAVDLGALRNVVLFSSVSARFGNRGQADYAAANEVLNKIAQRLSAVIPTCRVRSLNWGPWDGGMVGPGLKREFQRRGVELIGLEAGAAALVEELSNSGDGIEVVLGAGFPEAAAPPASVAKGAESRPSTTVAFERKLDLEGHSFLRSHVLGGRPVLPLAMTLEWIGHAALHCNPGLRLCGVENLRVLKGVAIEDTEPVLRFHVSEAQRKDSIFLVDVELRGEGGDGQEILHAAGTVVLSARQMPAPAIAYSDAVALQKYPRDLRTAYAEILFHGRDLRGIQKVDGWSSGGIVALVQPAPAPAQWMRHPLRSDWITDPLVVDSAFQLAILWCFEELGMVSLPSSLGSYRQFRSSFPRDGVTAVLEVREHTQRKMICDVTFFDLDAKVVARIEGYTCTTDPSLRAAFRQASVTT